MSTNVIGCTVFIDGQPISDGCSVTRDDAPAVLSGLRVVWGRTGSVDQATASTCTFAIDDPLTGDRLVPSLTIGRQVDVQADTIVYPNPDQPTLDGLYPGPLTNVQQVTGSGTDSNEVLGGPAYRSAVIVYPPRPYSQSPIAWDDVPRTLPGQPWALSASLSFPAAFAGWRAYAAVIQPVAFTSPAGPGHVLTDNLALSPDVPAGTLPFTPPPGVWLGLQVSIYPASPRWLDLDETSWADLADVAVRTNRAPNPRAIAAGSNGWVTSRGWGGGGAGTYSFATGLPAPADAPDVTTARRKTWTTASFNNSASGFMIQATSALNFAAAPGELITIRYRTRYSAATRKRLQPIVLPSATTDAASAQVGPNLAGALLIPPDGDNGWQTITYSFTQPAGAQGFKIIADAQQGGTTGNSPWLVGDTFDVTGLQIMVQGSMGTTYFDGSTPDTSTQVFEWTGAANASSSTAGSATSDASSWDDLSRFTISGVELLAPPEGAASSGLVFSGRITDVAAEWDGGTSARVSVIAQDWLAELANRFVGDQPWPEEQLGIRAQRIVTLSGQPIALKVDSGIGALPVTYRDVDRQPAANLLQQLAQSGAGILWTATHLVTGQTMWIENTALRPAALTLSDDGGLVHVVPAAGAIGHALPISACNVEADPIRFGLDMSDTVSEVALTWKEQVTDEGVIKPADRTVTERDVTTEQLIGARRLAVSTQLSHEADAQTMAQLWLARRSPLGWRVEGLVWDTSLRPGLSPDDTATVMTLLDGMRRIGLPIALTDMPEWTWPISGGAGEVALYVEGGTYDYRAGSWVLELNTSSATASAVGSLPWTALDAGWAWDEFDPAVTWLDLFGVTYPDV